MPALANCNPSFHFLQNLPCWGSNSLSSETFLVQVRIDFHFADIINKGHLEALKFITSIALKNFLYLVSRGGLYDSANWSSLFGTAATHVGVPGLNSAPILIQLFAVYVLEGHRC